MDFQPPAQFCPDLLLDPISTLPVASFCWGRRERWSCCCWGRKGRWSPWEVGRWSPGLRLRVGLDCLWSFPHPRLNLVDPHLLMVVYHSHCGSGPRFRLKLSSQQTWNHHLFDSPPEQKLINSFPAKSNPQGHDGEPGPDERSSEDQALLLGKASHSRPSKSTCNVFSNVSDDSYLKNTLKHLVVI